MSEHTDQNPTPREMVRAHAGIVLQLITTISAVVMAASLVPLARQAKIWDACYSTAVQWHSEGTPDDKTEVIKAWATRFCSGGSLRPGE